VNPARDSIVPWRLSTRMSINNQDFTGKVALVTGAGAGMGLATAQAFAEAGASVVLADRDEASVVAAAERLTADGHKAIAVVCDVADDAQVTAMVNRAIAEFGRLDAAYNNAGVNSDEVLLGDLPDTEWHRILSINLRAVWVCMREELRVMVKQSSGAIVNCSSLAGVVGASGRGAYSAAKHGVIGLTRSAALEYVQKGIRINAVCPGMIQTPMADEVTKGSKEIAAAMAKEAPIGRFGTAEEIAAAVLWLCSPGASYVIGHPLVVDGGFTVK
jgi:NAD(P)-dependent dehydrogenase (short-subunit alcohol dehydrogenase family)